jgi:hypothetical protein
VDLHERHDLETVDSTNAYEESGSPLLETPLFGHVAEIDSMLQERPLHITYAPRKMYPLSSKEGKL